MYRGSSWFALLASAGSFNLATSVHGFCLAGQSCFPSASELAAFNASIGGLLISQRPVGAVCYKHDPLYNAALCNSEYSSGDFVSDQWISDQPSGYQEPNWASCGLLDSCTIPNSLNGTLSCGQGNVPQYAVVAQTQDHIVSYVNFAVKHNLRIVVKNTGHDFKGRSAGKGGFALWTHHLNSTTRDTAFVPKGCQIAPHDSVRLGAGVQWGTAYAFAAAQGITLVGGDTPQVGAAGGWILGGGHSFLSPTLGLGVDNLLEVDIVTPDGVLQTISECSNPDLFWAVRGGGGGTFGVLVSVTYKAHPPTPVSFVFGSVPGNRILGLNDTNAIVSALASVAPRLGDLGVGGLFSTEPISGATYILFDLPGGDQAALENATAPFFSRLHGVLEAGDYYTVPTFYDFYTAVEGPDSGSGTSAALSSRLIPRSYFTPQKAPLLVAAIQAGQAVFSATFIPLLFQIILAPPSKVDLVNNSNSTSVNPVWYDSLWHVIYATAWETHAVATLAADPLRALTPDAGAYQNEADTFEPNHQASFWGSNYARLSTIKKTIDPKNVLQVWQGVGYDQTDSAFQCYTKLL